MGESKMDNDYDNGGIMPFFAGVVYGAVLTLAILYMIIG